MTDPAEDANADLRARMTELRSAMGEEERRHASSVACTRMANLTSFRQASVIMLYMPISNELDPTPLAIRAFQSGKTVCVPKVDWERGDMSATEVTSFDDHVMEADEHGFRTPREGRLLVPGSIDVLVVPGLAFDAAGRRLGRGGGHYGRFISRLRRSAIITGLAFDMQIIDDVPEDEETVRLPSVVTERRVSHAKSVRTRH